MVKTIKQIIKKNKIFNFLLVNTYRKIKSVLRIPHQIRLYCVTKQSLLQDRNGMSRIYYIGIPAHNNLGDLAQGVCIRRWLKKHYSDKQIIEIETNAFVNTRFSALKHLKEVFDCQNDFIIFQSGYTTTDLGGYADQMHCAVIELLPDAKILMMPQTIFFESEDRKLHTSQVYNSAENMVFLARDRVSFDMAKEMFPDLPVEVYPDIVTTLIGQYQYSHNRDGIIFCCRDDSEQYYSNAEISALMKKCAVFTTVEKTDTTKNIRTSEIVQNAQTHIMNEIERYSKYRLMITDRYHGTIFSLVAGTPVIIIKTTDHKVTTGAEWFKGVYDDYVFLADSLEDAYVLSEKILHSDRSHKLQPYFEQEFYDKLPEMFAQKVTTKTLQ